MRKRTVSLLSLTGLTAVLLSLLLLLLAHAGRTAASATAANAAAVTFTKDGAPLSGTVRLLCYATPDARPHADRLLTVAAGTAVDPLPADCTYAAALQQLHVQPSGFANHGPAYTVYHTNWTAGTAVPPPVGSAIQISQDNALTLFHVVVSLGWEPAPGTANLDPAAMRAALRDASAYLYDLSEGQMALGPVAVYTGGALWDSADMRVLPANDYRPAAFVGGIVKESTAFTSSSSEETLYTPAGIYLGRSWDAARGPTPPGAGLWTTTPTGTHTLIHEWNHYGLFLYDEYQQSSGSHGYCTCAALPSAAGCGLGNLDASAMAYHYTADELWHDFTHAGADNFCQQTWQFHFHGLTDWKTIANWGAIQSLPLSPIAFPSGGGVTEQAAPGLAADLFATDPGFPLYLPTITRNSGAAPAPPTEAVVQLATAALPAGRPVHAELYLLEGGSSSPSRILYQGQPVGPTSGDQVGKLTLLGVRNADRVRAFVTRYDDGGRFSFPPSSSADTAVPTNGALYANAQPWEYELSHHFEVENGQVATLTLALETTAVANPPVAQLCSPDANVGCAAGWQQPMTDAGSGLWVAAFTRLPGMAELPRHSAIRIVAPELGVKGEIIQWLQVHGGVGPGHGDAIAPLADGQIMLNTTDLVTGSGDCNVASYSPAGSSAALQAPFGGNIGGIVGQPLQIRVLLPGPQTCPTRIPGQTLSFSQNVILNFGYEQADVDQLGINEAQLQLLRFVPGSGWTTWQTLDVNTELNWVIGLINDEGIYAIGYP